MGSELRDALAQIISLIILALPLFLLPALLKLSAGILGRINDLTRRQVGKFGGDQAESFRKDQVKQAYDNSRLKGGLQFRRQMREYRGVLRRGRTPDAINRIIGGEKYVDSARRRAASYEKKEDIDAINDADTQQSHLPNRFDGDIRRSRVHIATGQTKTFIDKFGNEQEVSEYGQIAAAQKLLESGNFAERSMIYDSINEDSPQMLREQVSGLYFKKGDTAAMTPKYGGDLLAGKSGGKMGRLGSVAERIQNGQVTPSAMVHDAQATEDILTVASGKMYQYDKKGDIIRDEKKNPIYAAGTHDYGLTQDKIDGLARVAAAALTNEETAQKAIAPTYYDKLNAVVTLDRSGTVSPPPTAPPAGGGGTPGGGTP